METFPDQRRFDGRAVGLRRPASEILHVKARHDLILAASKENAGYADGRTGSEIWWTTFFRNRSLTIYLAISAMRPSRKTPRRAPNRTTSGVRTALRKTSSAPFTCCTKTLRAVWRPASRPICERT